MKDLMGIMKQAKTMQAKMEVAQAQIADLVSEGRSGGGLVTVVLTGENNMQSLKLDPSILTGEETEMVEDLIMAAYQDAKIKLDQKRAATMKEIMGDIPLPPGMGF